MLTSHSKASAPESSRVLKKIGAIFPPIHIPACFLFGMNGMSSPICQRREFVADFLEDPVPTTSPTKTTGRPDSLSFSIVAIGFSIVFLSIASACNGISGLDGASGAGERSSVLISPSTLKTMALIISGSSGREVNHSALDQESTTRFAFEFF